MRAEPGSSRASVGVHGRVLGIDPGLTRCGVALVAGPSHRPRAELATVVRTARDRPTERRLADLHDALVAILEDTRPDAVACERVLFSANARTAMGVGQAAGVALLAAARAGLPVATYSPNDVKLTVAGHGAADKDAVARLVAAQLHLDEIPRPTDVTDALAVALCHLARGGALSAPSGDGGWEAVLDRPHVRVASVIGGSDRRRESP